MLEIKYASSSYIADVIADLLYKCISNWDLSRCVIAIITDNGSNMKVVTLTIKELIFNLATNLMDSPPNNIDYNNKNTIFEETEIEINNKEIISNITNKKISIKNPLNTNRVLYKELDLELEDKKNEIIQKFCDEFINELNSDKSTLIIPVAELSNPTIPFPDAESSLYSQKEYCTLLKLSNLAQYFNDIFLISLR
ncbi:hypothetical protein RCL_jg7491.t1 [Rhizophagus clarus]|uniref:DUF659 domain-containing protein n=1 Tax=Rhizophagus clarus TaxID=94130 RepID=A0A8H3L062_9GLOM|nr:hypothetical protein RCL_jg7491.t1 [Rhizophagus clarus]